MAFSENAVEIKIAVIKEKVEKIEAVVDSIWRLLEKMVRLEEKQVSQEDAINRAFSELRVLKKEQDDIKLLLSKYKGILLVCSFFLGIGSAVATALIITFIKGT